MSETLTESFESCFKRNKKYVCVKIKMNGFLKPEIIVNERQNFDTKLTYYKNAYNENLVLKSYSGIKIVGFMSMNSILEVSKYIERNLH